jgi:dTDP-4-amino-4,6-dideoxygalactose transaminase
VEWQTEPPGCVSNRYFLVGKAPAGTDPAHLRRALLADGIDLGVGGEITDLCVPPGDRARFPSASDVYARAIQLPLFDRMPARAVERIGRALRRELARRG